MSKKGKKKKGPAPAAADLLPSPVAPRENKMNTATELPSSDLGRLKLIELQAPPPSPTPTRAEEHIASVPSPAAAALARS